MPGIGYDPLELASMANNVYIGCTYYIYYLREGFEIDDIVKKYFDDAPKLIEELKKATASKLSKHLIWGSSSDVKIKNMEKTLKEFEDIILPKILEGKASEDEVERIREFVDYIATYNLLESHAEWLEELEKRAAKL